VIHVYAFADELRELPAFGGIDGAPLELREIEGVAAVISRRSGASDAESLRADALVHGGVVEALADRAAAVLPVRFGESAPDDESFVRTVQARADGLRRRLEHVRGCVEVGLRVVEPHDAERAEAATGTEYMLSLEQGAAAGQRAVEGLHRELGDLAREARLRRAGNEYIGAYLVPREDLAAAEQAVKRFAAEQPGLTVFCTGPWAPYSFAEALA
jgi:hypothetical protein